MCVQWVLISIQPRTEFKTPDQLKKNPTDLDFSTFSFFGINFDIYKDMFFDFISHNF